jgi:hypothetical protein
MDAFYTWLPNEGLASLDGAHKNERQSRFHEKTVLTIFCNGTGEHKSAILPE